MRTPVLPCFAQIDLLQDCEALLEAFPLQGSCGLYSTGLKMGESTRKGHLIVTSRTEHKADGWCFKMCWS